MKTPIWLLFFLVVSGTAFGQKGKLLPIDDAINLHWLTVEKNGSHRYFLDLRTEAIYECANYNIVHNFNYKEGDDNIVIRMKGIQMDEECSTNIGPATAKVDVSHLPGGVYKLRIQYKNYDPFIGELHVTGQEMRIVQFKEGMMILGNPQVRKIPADLIWGTIEYKENHMRRIGMEFLVDMQNEGARQNALRPGNYGLFYLQEKGDQSEHPSESGGICKPFAYHYDGDISRIRLLIKMYADKHGDNIKINLYTASGEEYLSSNL